MQLSCIAEAIYYLHVRPSSVRATKSCQVRDIYEYIIMTYYKMLGSPLNGSQIIFWHLPVLLGFGTETYISTSSTTFNF